LPATLVAVVGAFVGCSQDAESEGLAGQAASEFCGQYADTLCGAQSQCHCFDPAAADLCRAIETQRCANAVGDSVEAKRQRYDAQSASDCLAQLTPYVHSCDPTDDEWPEACDRVFQGAISSGPCPLPGDCAAGTVCADGECVPLPVDGEPCDAEGRCAPSFVCVSQEIELYFEDEGAGIRICMPPASAGEECMGLGHCAPADTLQCDVQLTFQCQPLLGADELCTATSSCRADLYCPDVPDTCQPAPLVGEPCESVCVQGAYCDYWGGPEAVCVALPQAGEACQIQGDATCAGETDCLAVCTARRSEGEPCDPWNPGECQDGFVCLDIGGQQFAEGICQQPLGLGEPCSDSSECASTLYCADHSFLCEARLGSGDACDSSDECQAGFYCPSDAGAAGCVAQNNLDGCESTEECLPGYFCPDQSGASCTPKLADNELCTSSEQCQDGWYCAGAEDGTGDSTCRPRLAIGADCGLLGDVCELSAFCSTSEGRCRDRALVGEPCGPDRNCRSGLYCPDYTGANGPVCADREKAGDTCLDVAGTDPCVAGHFCSLASGKCVKLPGPGDSCATNYQQDSGLCRAGHYCSADNLCLSLPFQDEACSSDEQLCAPDFACVLGSEQRVCAERLPAGASCTDAEQCLASSCSGGICAESSDPVCTLIWTP
jgi:hypothetical protein